MRIALAIVVLAVSAWLAASPSNAASKGCASLRGVLSFHGHALLSFSSSASGGGKDQGGQVSITLHRAVEDLQVILTPKVVGKWGSGRYVFFSGRVRGGHVVVKDDYSTDTMQGALTYNGGSSSKIPVLAGLVFDRIACQYVFQAGFAVDNASYNGDASLRPVTRLGAGATSERYHIPANLHLNGGDGPEAGGTGCDDPIVNDKSCYSFSGGWSTDFETLFKCNSLSPEGSGCASSDTSVGTAIFTWSLTPTYAK